MIRAVGPLISSLKDPDWRVRSNAIYALGGIGDTRAVEPLMLALKDDSGVARYHAEEALKKMGWQLPTDPENNI